MILPKLRKSTGMSLQFVRATGAWRTNPGIEAGYQANENKLTVVGIT